MKQVGTTSTQAGKDVKRSMDTAKKSADGFGGALKKLFIAAGGFIILRKLNQTITESIRLFGIQAEAEAKVESTIIATGQAAGVTTDELKKMAREMQNVTKFGDEVILRGQSMLLTFKQIGKDVFPAATETMLNLAEAMGTDVKEQAIQLGKALNDPITGLTALRRVGITFSDAQERVIKNMQKSGDIASAQKLILAELESQFGGLARAAAEVGTGSLVQFQNRADDIKELLGQELLPVVLENVKAFEQFTTAGKDAEALQKRFKTFADSIRILIAVFRDVFQFVQINFKIMSGAFLTFNSIFVTGLGKMIQLVRSLIQSLPPSFVPDGWIIGITNAEEAVRNAGKAMRDTAKDLAKSAFGDVKQITATVDAIKKFGVEAEKAEKISGLGVTGGVEGVGDGGETETQKKAREKAIESARAFELMQLEGAERMKNEKIRIAEEEATKLKEIADREIKIQRAKTNALISIGRQGATLVSEVFGAGKAIFLFQKSLAAAEVVVNTMRGIAAAIAEPYGTGLPRIPFIKATGAFALATILAQSIKGFQDGGFINQGTTRGDQTLARVNRNEVVLNPGQQRNFMAIANGRRGGSSVPPIINMGDTIVNSSSGNPVEIAEAVNQTNQEKLRALQDILNEKDALLVT
jgi:hypothetical protein